MVLSSLEITDGSNKSLKSLEAPYICWILMMRKAGLKCNSKIPVATPNIADRRQNM